MFQYLHKYRGLPPSPGLLQSNYVYDADGQLLLDFVGRFENLSADIEKIKKQIDLEFELPHLRRTKRRPLREAYTAKGMERVYQLWKPDFENFDYTLTLDGEKADQLSDAG